MNSLPESRRPLIHIILIVWLFLASTVAVLDSIALTRLRPELARRTEVAVLNERLDRLERQLTDLAQQKPATVSRMSFLTSQKATDERIAHLEASLAEAAQREELATWQERLSATEAQVAKLRHREGTLKRPPMISRAAESSQKPEPEAPFQVLGIEMRGGEPFLSLLPTGVHSLSDVRVLRVGERDEQWQLQKLDGRTAEFQVDGHTRRIDLPQEASPQ